MTFIFSVLMIGIIGCEHKEPTPEEKAKIRAIGDKASDILLGELKSRLIGALQQSGPSGAIEACKLDAILLTEKATNLSETPIKVKRTTHKYRNPQNAPDQWEKKALAFFESKVGERDYFPEFYVQKIRHDNQTLFRYYKPLKVYTMCLNCHGQQITNDVKTKLDSLYPNDLATGYSKNDFRGVIRVEISEEHLQ